LTFRSIESTYDKIGHDGGFTAEPTGSHRLGDGPASYAWPMWRPRDIDDFEAAVGGGALQERHDFDAKRQLPASNKELAKDLAAMSTDGGSLIYGVAEDGNGQPRLLSPIELDGAAERIDQVAQHSISGYVRLEFVHLRRPAEAATGYLVVVVPASPEAPHQVTVGDDRRFYGRSDTGNRRLSEVEVARLYERRARQGRDREQLLDECIASAPTLVRDGRIGLLHAFAAPALPDEELWDRAVEARGNEQTLLRELREALASASSVGWGGTTLSSPANWMRRGADRWSLERPEMEPGRSIPRPAVRADLGMDGRADLFQAEAAAVEHRHPGAQPLFVLYERGIALTLAQFMALAGALYKAGGLYGAVDVGMAVTGIEGAVSAHSLGDRFLAGTPYGEDCARRTERCDARDLQEDPQSVSRRLLARLFSASLGRDLDPLAEE
jgi:hypothetical protein